jgi:PAS domain S-box-containing protein
LPPPDGDSRSSDTSAAPGVIPAETDYARSGLFFWLFTGALLAFLYYAHLQSFLLFHVLVEIFSVVVAFAIFMFAWNTRERLSNGSLVLLGAAYLWIGALDLLHTVSYKGMGVLPTSGANAATQLWIAARYLESGTLTVATFLAGRAIRMRRAVMVYAALFGLTVAAIFAWPVFPDCFIEGQGLTPFKKISEYAIAGLLLVGLANLSTKRKHFASGTYRLLMASILLTIASELLFTFYVSVYGFSNLVGHLCKLGSFWMIYKAIIETGLRAPYDLLFRELASSEKRYRQLVDGLPTGICEIGPDARIRYINPAGLELIGYSEADIRNGLALDAVLDPAGHDKSLRRLERLRRGAPVESTSYRLRRKDGDSVDVIVSTTPVYREGKLQRVQTSLTDVTELHRLYDRLHEARKMEAVAVLAGGMAHEINNLLMGVTGGIELLKLSAAQGELEEEDIAAVLRGCDRIAELVKRLLAYSRGGRYRLEEVDPSRLLLDLRSQIEERLSPEIHLQLDASDNLPRVSGDPTQLEMVVLEIIANAAEAVGEGGRVRLALEVETIGTDRPAQAADLRPGCYVRLTVQDNGKGMTAETRELIFDPFYSEHFPGRGMGMAAVYGIVSNHGGGIEIASEPGRGTTVHVYLPAAGRDTSGNGRGI